MTDPTLACQRARQTWCRWLAALVWLLTAHMPGWASDVSLGGRYWLDPTGQATLADVTALPATAFQPMDSYQSHVLDEGALWIQPRLPDLPASEQHFLELVGSAFFDAATLHQPSASPALQVQKAGDHLPVAQWNLPDQSPVFLLEAPAHQSAWLRVANKPAPTNPRLQLISASELKQQRYWTLLGAGAYFGFGLLVLFLGTVHWGLYRDRAFIAYCVYVSFMLGFQLAFTGLGGLFFWDGSPRWNDKAPAIFMLWLTASGIWFVREVCALSRYSVLVDRLVLAWCVLGLVFPVVYFALFNSLGFTLLNLYGLLSVLLSIGLCVWVWHQGMAYAGWLFLGFAPLHLAYPFPALRAAGLMPDSWLTQYALMVGSALEIAALLYILHRRARDFNESRARLRALDSTDVLTGLALLPVLHLRLRDALRRARNGQHRLGLLVVGLANHADIATEFGRDAGDKALVVAAARLSGVVRDFDTVCRLDDTHFAILVEGPLREEDLRRLAQHVIAKGLEIVQTIGPLTSLRFHVATALPPDGVVELSQGAAVNEERLLARLRKALRLLDGDAKRQVVHLPLPPREGGKGNPSTSPVSAPPGESAVV